jgi:hypothetical protein
MKSTSIRQTHRGWFAQGRALEIRIPRFRERHRALPSAGARRDDKAGGGLCQPKSFMTERPVGRQVEQSLARLQAASRGAS